MRQLMEKGACKTIFIDKAMIMMQENDCSARKLIKMEQVIQSLRRGLADADAGRLSDGYVAITRMIEMEEDVAADGIG